MPIYSSDSDDDVAPSMKLFGRQKSIHTLLGGGKVADVLLWRNKSVSAALLTGITVIWFLFEVVHYNLVTLLCHLFITIMLVIFIWCNCADIFKWTPPKIPEIVLNHYELKEAVSIFHARFNQLLSNILSIACGNDIQLFFLAVFSLWILSMIGTYYSFLNLLFLGLLCIQTLPFLYERYEDDVDYLGAKMYKQAKKIYRRFDSNVLNKIPRGPLKRRNE